MKLLNKKQSMCSPVFVLPWEQELFSLVLAYWRDGLNINVAILREGLNYDGDV